MDELQQAHHELDRLQGIITRHEDHMFALRGWLLVIVGGLLTAYYTANVDMGAVMLRIALVLIALLFLVVESRHVNLVEAVVERVAAVETQIATANMLQRDGSLLRGWYDGPRVNEACQDGAGRWWPRGGMTFILNQPFYIVVIVIIVLTTVSLPPKQGATVRAVPNAQAAPK
jgi:uncharacterized membrane protein